MTFTQHQKFLSTYKKYYFLCYRTPNSKLSGQYFYNSNFILKSNRFFLLNSLRTQNPFAFKHLSFIHRNKKNSVLKTYNKTRDLKCLYTNKHPCFFRKNTGAAAFLPEKGGCLRFINVFSFYSEKWNHKFSVTIGTCGVVQNFIIPINQTNFNTLAKRQRFIRNSLKGILLVNFPEKEKNFLIKNLAAENKIALITQSASLLLKDSRNMDDLLGVDDPIQILFDKVKTCIPCICFINNLDRIGKQRYEKEQKSLHWLNNSISLLQKKKGPALSGHAWKLDQHFTIDNSFHPINAKQNFDLPIIALSNKGSDQKILKYLTWFKQSSNKNQLQPIKPFFNLLIKLSMGSKDSMYTNANKQSFSQFSIKRNIPEIINSTSIFSKLICYRCFEKKISYFRDPHIHKLTPPISGRGENPLTQNSTLSEKYNTYRKDEIFGLSPLIFKYSSSIRSMMWNKKPDYILKKKPIFFSGLSFNKLNDGQTTKQNNFFMFLTPFKKNLKKGPAEKLLNTKARIETFSFQHVYNNSSSTIKNSYSNQNTFFKLPKTTNKKLVNTVQTTNFQASSFYTFLKWKRNGVNITHVKNTDREFLCFMLPYLFRNKHFNKNMSFFRKLLTNGGAYNQLWSKKNFEKPMSCFIDLKGTWLFKAPWRVGLPDGGWFTTATGTKKKLLLSPPGITQSDTVSKFSNSFYRRLPYWLFKNSFFLKGPKANFIGSPFFTSGGKRGPKICFETGTNNHKIKVNKVKLFNAFYDNKKKKENILISLQQKVNPFLLQMAFCQILSDTINPIFTKTQHKMVNTKTNFKNIDSIYKTSLLNSPLSTPAGKAEKKDSLMESNNTEIFKKAKIVEIFSTILPIVVSERNNDAAPPENKLKLISKTNSYNRISSKRKLDFKDLGSPFSIVTPVPVVNHPPSRVFGKDGPKTSFEKEPSKITETEIIKRTALLKFLQILDGFHTTTKKKKSVSRQGLLFIYLNMFRLASQTKDKFVFKNGWQGKGSPTNSLNKEYKNLFVPRSFFSIFPFPDIVPWRWFSTRYRVTNTVTEGPKKRKVEKRKPFLLKKLITPLAIKKMGWPEKNKLSGGGGGTSWMALKKDRLTNENLSLKLKKPRPKNNDKSYFFSTNFWSSQVLRKKSKKAPPRNYNNPIILNLIQNNMRFPRTNILLVPFSKQIWGPSFSHISVNQAPSKRSGKREKPIYLFGKERFIRPSHEWDGPKKKIPLKNSFLSYALQKKTFQSFKFASKIPRWELYLKNQPSVKSLNLLCVWPSYIEDKLGPLNMNDSASYILPEYFQLLGHGPKLKKQGITLIASTNNLETLDAALLRPGRFDTIINFSHSFSSIYRSYRIIKHSPSLTQNNEFSLNLPINNLTSSVFKRGPYLFSLINISKVIQDQLSTHITVLDIPNQSIPIKTFIDVSIFIQYKLWWNFHNEKLSWFGLYQKGLVQKPKARVSNIENFKIFKPNTVLIILKFPIQKMKNLIYIFMTVLRLICFKFPAGGLFQFFITFSVTPFKKWIGEPLKTKLVEIKNKDQVFMLSEKQKLPLKYSENNCLFDNQSFNSINALGRAVLTSRVIILGLPKNLSLCNSVLDQNYTSSRHSRQTYTVTNSKNRTIKNFRSNFHTENSNMFLKFNRRLLFCIGDFDYQTYSKNDSEIILNTPFTDHLPFQISDPKAEVSNIPPWRWFMKTGVSTIGIGNSIQKKRKTKPSGDPRIKNLKSEFNYSCSSIDLATAFLDESSKIWKDSGKTVAIKNININHSMLTKYNEIYKLKKIKLKKHCFFNLHPLTSFMLKRWPEVTKFNKLKRHLKISLINICLPWKNEIYNNKEFASLKLSPNINSLSTQIYHNLSNTVLIKPISTTSLKKESSKTVATNSFFSIDESYLFKKLSTNFSLNIIGLQAALIFGPSNESPHLPRITDFVSPVARGLPLPPEPFKKGISNELFRAIPREERPDNSNTSSISWLANPLERINSRDPKNKISHLHLLKKEKLSGGALLGGALLKKIPRKVIINDTYQNFQTRSRFKCFNVKTKEWEINDKIILLKNLVSNEKKEHNLMETSESFLKNSWPQLNSLNESSFKMSRLDISFFVLIFYAMFFEKIQHKKITLNTIKIFMPYRSLILSHFLLSQANSYGFSCKNFEILIYNKFKNLLVDL